MSTLNIAFGSSKVLVLRNRDHSNRKGECWPGIKTIAKELQPSKSTVKRALADLKKSDYLQKVARHRENGSNTSNLSTVR